MSILEKSVSALVRDQFPALYRESGSSLVDLVVTYYEWLESESYDVSGEKITGATLTLVKESSKGTGTGLSVLSSGDKIAVWRNEEYYDVVTVDEVVSDEELTLTKPAQRGATDAEIALTEKRAGANWLLRSVTENTDSDDALESLLGSFGSTYLAGIQRETAIDDRLFVKHALDLYRSKGSERAVELLFRALYGVEASVYLPSVDVLSPSSGEWVVPRYLELSLNERSAELDSERVIGLSSGATAFVDRMTRKSDSSGTRDVAYVSAITGEFVKGETLTLASGKLSPDESPKILGSLGFVETEAIGTGSGFSTGDVVQISSDSRGIGGTVRVANTSSLTGRVSANLTFGGTLYGLSPTIDISSHVLSLKDVVTSNSYFREPHPGLNVTVTQTVAALDYHGATGSIANGTVVTQYHANGAVRATGVAYSVSETSSTNGTARVVVSSGNLSTGNTYSVGNSVLIDADSISYSNAIGTFVGSVNEHVSYSSNTGALVSGSVLTKSSRVSQYDPVPAARATIRAALLGNDEENAVFITDRVGTFLAGETLSHDNGTLVVASLCEEVGVTNVSGTFVANGYVSFSDGTSGVISTVYSSGSSLANVSVEQVLNDSVTFSRKTTPFSLCANTLWAAPTYPFPDAPTANATTVFYDDCLSSNTVTLGDLTGVVVNPGAEYSRAPRVRIREPLSFGREIVSKKIATVSAPVFTVGETVEQESTGWKGRVLSQDSSGVFVRTQSWDSVALAPTTNSSSVLTGASSGHSSNVVSSERAWGSRRAGLDASVSTTAVSGNGAASSVAVTDSGFGYVDGDAVWFDESGEITASSGRGIVRTVAVGTGSGRYESDDGRPSSLKKIRDGHYYQQFSYDVRTSVQFDKYEKSLRDTVHPAGVRPYGTLVITSATEVAPETRSSLVTTE